MPKILTRVIHHCGDCTNRSQMKELSHGFYSCKLKDKPITVTPIPVWCPLEDQPYKLTPFDDVFVFTYGDLSGDKDRGKHVLEDLIAAYHNQSPNATPNWFCTLYSLWQIALKLGQGDLSPRQEMWLKSFAQVHGEGWRGQLQAFLNEPSKSNDDPILKQLRNQAIDVAQIFPENFE